MYATLQVNTGQFFLNIFTLYSNLYYEKLKTIFLTTDNQLNWQI